MTRAFERGLPARVGGEPAPAYPRHDASIRVDLSDNTNRWGMPPSASRVIRELGSCAMRYPEPYAERLQDAVAGYCGVDADMITTGCGSDDVLDCAIRAFTSPGDRLVSCDPSFVMVPALARLNALHCVMIPFTAGWDADAAAILRADARVIYLCSPNNPTGTVLDAATVAAIADAASALVIVDEAYAEFAGTDCLALARSRPNVLVVRTMSKAFGLAGLRVGYGIGAPAMVRAVEQARGPFKVNALGAAAAEAAVREDVPWMRAAARLAMHARDRLARELGARGLQVFPSSANFVMARMAGALDVARRMRSAGVAVRAFGSLAGIGDALRITVGPDDEMAAALAALDAALEGLGPARLVSNDARSGSHASVAARSACE